MYTLGGGLSEPRASLLAGKGFVVLALAYYRYQGLPKNPQNLDLGYFEEALTYLRSRPEVSVKDAAVTTIIIASIYLFVMFAFYDSISPFLKKTLQTDVDVLETQTHICIQCVSVSICFLLSEIINHKRTKMNRSQVIYNCCIFKVMLRLT